MADAERSPEARTRAERALVWLLSELHDEDLFLVVLGGLVPSTLTAGDDLAPQHLGTTDVDLLLGTDINLGKDLGSVERALERLQFEPDPEQDGWRWQGKIEGVSVVIEFLCDLDSEREGESIRPAGCKRLAAANLRGTGHVARDFELTEITGVLADGTVATVNARFAGLQGYLLSKCVAARTRAADKDYYDLAYVLLHNRAGGPEEAAAQILSGELRDAIPPLRSALLEVQERYRRPTDSGPAAFARQAKEVEPEANDAVLRADAIDAVGRFIAALEL